MKIIAITDETNICECCGKRNLKKVVVLQNDNGDIFRYGVDCAAKALKKMVSMFKNEVEMAERVQRFASKYAPEVAVKALHNYGYIGAQLIDGAIVIKSFQTGAVIVSVKV